jgi:hypothetical protein
VIHSASRCENRTLSNKEYQRANSVAVAATHAGCDFLQFCLSFFLLTSLFDIRLFLPCSSGTLW